MRISLPVLLPAGTVFRPPTKQNVGAYTADPLALFQTLQRFFIQVQTAGWEIMSITSVTGGVYNWANNASQNYSWGYGWGTSATEGMIVVVGREVRHEDLSYLPIVHEAVGQIAGRIKMAMEKRAELTNEIQRIETATIATNRKGLMARVTGYGFLEHEFPTEQEAVEKKRSMLEAMNRSVVEFDERISAIRVRDHITGVPPDVLERLVPPVPIGDIAQSFQRLLASTES